MNDQLPGASLPYARLEPQFAQLCAILGWRIKTTDQWLPWERLFGIYGWKRLLRAVERCEPGQRWPQDAEKMLREMARLEADIAKQALQDLPKPKTKADSAAWAAVIAKVKGTT